MFQTTQEEILDAVLELQRQSGLFKWIACFYVNDLIDEINDPRVLFAEQKEFDCCSFLIHFFYRFMGSEFVSGNSVSWSDKWCIVIKEKQKNYDIHRMMDESSHQAVMVGSYDDHAKLHDFMIDKKEIISE